MSKVYFCLQIRAGAVRVIADEDAATVGVFDAEERLTLSDGTYPAVLSTLTSGRLRSTPSAQHWADHARGAVAFSQTVDYARTAGCSVFIEVGMTPHLTPHILDIAAASEDGDEPAARTPVGRSLLAAKERTKNQPVVAVPTLRKVDLAQLSY